MRSQPFHRPRSSSVLKLSGRLSLLALTAGLGAGCMNNIFPSREPIFTGSTQNQKEIIANRGASAGVQTASVQSSDLPPPAGAAAPVAMPPAVAEAPKPYTPPQPYAASGLPTPVGQVAALPTPRPAGRGASPKTLGEQAAAIGGTGNAAGGSHLVQAGDTAWNISRRYGITVDQLAAANGGSSTVKLGQRMTIPGGRAAAAPPVQVASVDPQATPTAAAMPAPAPVGLPPSAAELPALDPAAAAAPSQASLGAPESTPAAAGAAATPEGAAASGFRWPVRGRVISGFGKKPDGERNDGINLAVPEGTAVKAAEDGTVIYAGNELKSYGNLVLIRHANGWVSAYAHNGELKVNRGQAVRRGEIVATSGMSGGVTTPQVHFELRKDATPVDPLQHLTES